MSDCCKATYCVIHCITLRLPLQGFPLLPFFCLKVYFVSFGGSEGQDGGTSGIRGHGVKDTKHNLKKKNTYLVWRESSVNKSPALQAQDLSSDHKHPQENQMEL